MGTVPFASLGVFWLMMATGTPFNLMAMIGMVILIGIVVNNGIVLVDHVNQLRRAGWPLDEAILEGGARSPAPDPDDRRHHDPGPAAAGGLRRGPRGGRRVLPHGPGHQRRAGLQHAC